MIKPWYVYMVQCRDGSLYTGITLDPDARVAAHNAGRGGAYTRSRGPVTLLWKEVVGDRPAALRREHALKRMSRVEKLRIVKEKRGA